MGMKLKKSLNKISLLSITIGGWTIETPTFKWDFTTVNGTVLAINNILNFAVGFSIVVAVVMIIYGGYTFIMSNGDPENISKGGKILTAAVVGLVIVYLSKLLIMFVLKEFLLK